MTLSPVVEVVQFSLRNGVEETDFLAAADAVTQVIQTMSGYLRRELLKEGDDQWMDIIHWSSMEAAQHAAQSIMSIPAAAPFMHMIDESTTVMRHLVQVRTYEHAQDAQSA